MFNYEILAKAQSRQEIDAFNVDSLRALRLGESR
jgi:hypothetical protein